MPHYIRFLKTPRSTTLSSHVKVSSIITIVTDLGDSFFYDDLCLKVRLIASNRDDCTLAQEFEWTAGSRELTITLQCPRYLAGKDARLHLSARDVPSYDLETPDQGSRVVDAWSAPFQILNNAKAVSLIERRFSLRPGSVFSVWEETGNSIAHHIWYGFGTEPLRRLRMSGMLL